MMSEYYYNDLLATQSHLSRGSQMLKADEFLRMFSEVGIEVMDDDLAVRAEIDNSNETSLSYHFGSYTNSNYGSNKTHMRSKSHSNQPT